MLVMVLCAGAYDVEAVVGQGLYVRWQRIPYGLVKRMTKDTVWPRSLGSVTDRAVLLHILGSRLMHVVEGNAKCVDKVADSASVPRFSIRTDGGMSQSLTRSCISMAVNAVNGEVARGPTFVDSIEYVVCSVMTFCTVKTTIGNMFRYQICPIRVDTGIHGSMAKRTVLS